MTYENTRTSGNSTGDYIMYCICLFLYSSQSSLLLESSGNMSCELLCCWVGGAFGFHCFLEVGYLNDILKLLRYYLIISVLEVGYTCSFFIGMASLFILFLLLWLVCGANPTKGITNPTKGSAEAEVRGRGGWSLARAPSEDT